MSGGYAIIVNTSDDLAIALKCELMQLSVVVGTRCKPNFLENIGRGKFLSNGLLGRYLFGRFYNDNRGARGVAPKFLEQNIKNVKHIKTVFRGKNKE